MTDNDTHTESEAERNARLDREADERAEARLRARLAQERSDAEAQAKRDAEADARAEQRRKDAEDKRRWHIEYVEGDEPVKLSYLTPERREHEYARLLSTGVRGLKRSENFEAKGDGFTLLDA